MKLNIPLISVFDNEKIMAANSGALAVDVLSQVPDAVHFFTPMGGGSLSERFAWHIKDTNPHTRTTICQLEGCPTLQLSLRQNKPTTYIPSMETLEGVPERGLGEKYFDILKARVDEIAHIKEDELKEVFRWFLKNHQYLIEPSAAVGVASCLYGDTRLKDPTVNILTGRNVSYATIQQILGG